MSIGSPYTPVTVSTDPPQGGPALAVAGVTTLPAGAAALGSAALPVYLVSAAELASGAFVLAGNEPVPMLAVSGQPVLGQPPIPVYVVSGSLAPSDPILENPSFAPMGTTYTNNLSADGMTWAAQRGAFEIDSFGKYVQYVQRYNGGTTKCAYVVSNNAGGTWADKEPAAGGEGFLTRGAIVYDAGRDCLHQVCVTTNPGDGGMIYRRNTITRDGSNNITAITRAAGVSVSLDDPSQGAEFPTIIMTDANTLLIAWTARTALGGEIRCCKCDLSGDANAGGTASNWVHIGVNSTTTIGSAPAVGSYTIPYTQGSAVWTYFSLLQLAAGDLRWLYHSGPSGGQYRTRRSVRSAANVWNSLSSPAVVLAEKRAGTDTGYSLKMQLISSQSEDASGNVYAGVADWKDNAAGDTWTLVKITSADVVSFADVYSAGGPHSYAPTGDVAYDATADRAVASYLESVSQDAFVQLFTPALAAAASALLAYATNDVDIPLILDTRDNGKLLMGFRVAGSPPQIGVFGTLDWGTI